VHDGLTHTHAHRRPTTARSSLMTSARGRRAAPLLVLLAAVGLGAWLRLGRLDEMEYKRDEQWTFTHAVRIPADEPWPKLGMPSGITIPNAPLSLLVFVGLTQTSRPMTPVDLTARVVWLNVAALVLLVLFSETGVEADARDSWRWGAALVAVSPFAVLLERKLWAQSTLPLFSLLFLIGWFRRETRWGACMWGLLSAVLGQIHISGLFLAAAFGIWTMVAPQGGDPPAPIRWRWWAGGFAIGSIGLVQWFVQLAIGAAAWLRSPATASLSPVATLITTRIGLLNWHLLSFWPSFWWNWLCDAAGFGLNYSLGTHYAEFLAAPVVRGHSTWLMAIAAFVSMSISLAAAAPPTWALLHDLRATGLAVLTRNRSQTLGAEAATIGVFGLMLTATLHMIHRHYLVVLYPLPWIWLAGLLLRQRRGRALLCCVWLAQLVLTLGVLQFIHTHQGAPGADYGVGYRWQETTRVRD